MGVTKRAGRKGNATEHGPGRAGAVSQTVFASSKKKEVGVSDLTLVAKITNEAINDNLKLRFEHQEIYTYIGHVLVSVNPFRDLGIYTDATKNLYQDKNRLETPPHVYSIAESAHHAMTHYSESQCVIISGESGAGKTEAAKRMMEFLIHRTGISSYTTGKTIQDTSQEIKEKILATNPLLESFGNAKTLRNNNSSRFGKYLALLFKRLDLSGLSDKDRKQIDVAENQLEPAGATINNYLLEKSRVVGQTRNERNFHIFYQITKAAAQNHPSISKYKDNLDLQGPEQYLYLSSSGCLDVPGTNDIQDFEDMCAAMKTIDVESIERDGIFRMLAAVLWIGNITYVENEQGYAAIRDVRTANFVAQSLLHVDPLGFAKALTQRRVINPGEELDIFYNITQAIAVRDALAKAIYDKLFNWIVKKLNISLAVKEDRKKKPVEIKNTLGILDIYGFEIFEKNNFEQLCINYVNEKLQQIFIQLTLKAEQEEYAKERIQWQPIKYFDNKVVCDLIEGTRPPGVFAALNDACATAHADSGAADQTFVQRTNVLSSNAHFEPRQGHFVIKHYAGDVNYTIDGMTDKNKDQLHKDVLKVISETGQQFLKDLFPQQVNQDDRRRPRTAGDNIKISANDLVTTLMKSTPSYIRTIKPNEDKSPSEYNSGNVLHQIKYLGLQENVRIRRAGFAYRQTFERFFLHFFPLSPTISPGVDVYEVWHNRYGWDYLAGTKAILKDAHIPQDQFQLGVTKVFIKDPETLFALEEMKDKHWERMVVRTQKQWRKRTGNKVKESSDARREGHNMLQHKKERRRFSLLGLRRYLGDYLGIDMKGGYGAGVRHAIGLSPQERTKFSCRCERLVSKTGRSSKPEPRMLILTENAVYMVVVVLDKNQQASIVTERATQLGNIAYVSTSNLKDDWFSIVERQPDKTGDLLLSCIFKTEFFACLKKAKETLDIRIGDSIQYNKKPGKITNVSAIKDPSVARDDFYKSGKIHTGPGEPPTSESRDTPAEKQLPQAERDLKKTCLLPGQKPRPTKAEWQAAVRAEELGMPLPSQPTRASQAVPSVVEPTVQQPVAQRRVPPQPTPAINGANHLQETLTTRSARSTPSPTPPAREPPQPKKNLVKVLYDFDGAENQYAITKDEILESLNKEVNGWTHVTRGDHDGWAPTTYIEPYTPPPPARKPPRPPPPPPQTNGLNAIRSSGKGPPPLPEKRPTRRLAPPPNPRDSASSLGGNSSDSGRATPDSVHSNKSAVDVTSIANAIRLRSTKQDQ